MPASIGVNLRVTGHCSQGGRKYMEDLFSVAYQQTEDERDLEYAFFGIYDGHGGSEAAAFAKEHLMDSIVKQRQFWSDNDEDVLKAIRNGYMLTHLNMWKELEKWPKTVTGLPSTAGTTASVAFIRRGKIYIGHVGDSAIVLGYQKEGSEEWAAKPLTSDHKPESSVEMERIQRCGGKVVSKAGVPRVVWNRPKPDHKGPIKKNTPMDEIPFLAVARSLGDLWSYNNQNDEFIVSPDPDVGVLTIDPTKFRCLIFGTDGLWNMLSPEGAVSLVQATERHNEAALVGGGAGQPRDWLNPSKSLVDHALERWSNTRMRADNTSVVTLMLDPPGPPRATVLRSKSGAVRPQPAPRVTPAAADRDTGTEPSAETDRHVPQNGLTIMTRYSDADRPAPSPDGPLPSCATLDGRFSLGLADDADAVTNYGNPAESYFMARLLSRSRTVDTLSEVYEEIASGRRARPAAPETDGAPVTTVAESDADRERATSDDDVREDTDAAESVADPTERATDGAALSDESEDVGIQINEVSSSSPTDCPARSRGRKSKEARRPTAAPVDCRVLRSHDAEPPHRPQTRQAAHRKPANPQPPVAERVVILSRARAAPLLPPADPLPAPDQRATRSRDAGPAPRATRGAAGGAHATHSTRGNSPRAPGPARRSAPAAPQRDRSKENCGASRRRPAARCRDVRAAPPPRPRTRLADSSPAEVHSTTGELASRLAPPSRPLRSRNDARHPDEERPPASKAARLSAPERCTRTLGKRASVPWAPALALRNRLRKRLVK